VNRMLKVLVPGVLLAALLAAPASAEIKVGVVSVGRLVQESYLGKAAEEVIRNEFSARQRELQNLQVSLKSKEDKLQKDSATMSEAQRSSAEKELRDGARDFGRKQQEFQDDLNARRNEEMSRLQRSLLEEINAYAKAQGFDLVLADGVVYANSSIDITPAILTALQARKPAAAKPAAK
jgi:outer membrane protein